MEAPNCKKLFTPGPCNISHTVKQAMLRDISSRDPEFVGIVQSVRKELLEVAEVSADAYTSILLQGSGTFAVESVLQTTLRPASQDKILIFSNGAYGKRMVDICSRLQLDKVEVETDWLLPLDPDTAEQALRNIPDLTAVALVHSETTSGVVNPVEIVGGLVKTLHPKSIFIVDAMSSFGAIPISMERSSIDFLVSSSNKCLQGSPGLGIIIAKKTQLMTCTGISRSLSLDLVDQYLYLEKTGQFRFTPPTHTVLALKQALQEHRAEGGVEGRALRYKENCRLLLAGMKELGFEPLRDQPNREYIINSYRYPPERTGFNFEVFYDKLSLRGLVIYAGKLTVNQCFRIGTIGEIYPRDVKFLLINIREVLVDMGITIPVSA